MGDLSTNFSRSEFACKCNCGFDTVDIELIKVLEKIRTHFARPIQINSGCRCKRHNEAEGSTSKKSQHLYGRAADIFIMTVPPEKIAAYVDSKWPGRFGLGVYSSWVHIDSRTDGPARWG
jgi:uncharacterized protein YcbK (DUF882 family)